MAPAQWLEHISVILALIYMRSQPKRFPFPKGAYRNPLIVLLAFLAICVSMLTAPVIIAPMKGLVATSVLAIAFTLYYTLIKRRDGDKENTGCLGTMDAFRDRLNRKCLAQMN